MFTCVNALNSVAVRSNKLLGAERGCPTLGCLLRTGGVHVQPACEFEWTPGCNRYERHLRHNRFLCGVERRLSNQRSDNQHELQFACSELLTNGGFNRSFHVFYKTVPDRVTIYVHYHWTSMRAVSDF